MMLCGQSKAQIVMPTKRKSITPTRVYTVMLRIILLLLNHTAKIENQLIIGLLWKHEKLLVSCEIHHNIR